MFDLNIIAKQIAENPAHAAEQVDAIIRKKLAEIRRAYVGENPKPVKPFFKIARTAAEALKFKQKDEIRLSACINDLGAVFVCEMYGEEGIIELLLNEVLAEYEYLQFMESQIKSTLQEALNGIKKTYLDAGQSLLVQDTKDGIKYSLLSANNQLIRNFKTIDLCAV